MDSISRLRDLDRWLERRLAGEEGEAPSDPGSDDPLAARLLAAAERPLAALSRPPGSDPDLGNALAAALAESGEIVPGTMIGPFRIECAVGSGGMGVVYQARRVDAGFEQTVALKVLADQRPLGEVVDRFELERQLLSRLEHPGIARLIDGGVTSAGRPWFAMEYVQGQPIDTWCREQRLDLGARIELVIQVCEALEYAHGQMVLHRDIKPANILVDGEGRVRLVDFGLGKVQAELVRDEVEVTRMSRRWLTPEYASPEQLCGHAIDVRSEVYQAGLVLYRLLCADSPFNVTTDSPADWIEAVTRTAPVAPSARWRNNAQGAEQFGASAQRLIRRLKGDLDMIVLMALRKEPERRYRSMRALADDLRRYLDGRPVTARADSLGYRLGKFTRRHPAGLAASIGAGLLALGAVAVHVDQLQTERDRAQLEADKARVVSAFLTDLFEVANPVSHTAEPFTVESLVEAGIERIDEIETAPLSQAAVLRALSAVNQNIGDYDTAAELRQMEVDALLAADGVAAGRMADALTRLGLAHHERVDFDHAEAAYRQAQQVLEGSAGHEQAWAELLNALGNLMRDQGRFETAERHYREALEYIRASQPGGSFEATILNNLGTALIYLSHYREARDFFETALAIRREVLGPTHAWTTIPLGNLAFTLSQLGEFAEAEALYHEVVEHRIAALGEDHPRVAVPVHQVGRLKWEQRDHDGARPWLERALRIQHDTLGADHPHLAVGQMYLSQVLIEQGQLDAAESLIGDGLDVLRSAYEEKHRFVALGLWAEGNLRLALGQNEQARLVFEQSLDIRRQLHGDGHRDVARSLNGLAHAYDALGYHELARETGEMALSIYEAVHVAPQQAPEVRELALLLQPGPD